MTSTVNRFDLTFERCNDSLNTEFIRCERIYIRLQIFIFHGGFQMAVIQMVCFTRICSDL